MVVVISINNYIGDSGHYEKKKKEKKLGITRSEITTVMVVLVKNNDNVKDEDDKE